MRIIVMLPLMLMTACITGCATYEWRQSEQVNGAKIIKIETEIAPQFCSAFLGQEDQLACSIRIVNTTTKESRCVIVAKPGHLLAVRHEAGGHCMGQDH